MLRILWIIIFLILLLGLRFWFYYRDMPVYKTGDKARFVTTLMSEPEVSGGRQSFTVLDDKGTKISILSGGVLPYHYGDRLFIGGIFTVSKKRYFIYYPTIQIINSDHNFLSQVDIYIKTHSKNLLNGSIPPVSSALLLGMVFGGRQGLPAVFTEKLRTVGVIHVIAASGMNVTFVAAALVSLFGRVMKRQYVLLVSILGVLFYAFLAGFEPSIVRATAMAIIAFGAALLGRQYFALVSLLFTGYVMLFYQPSNIFNIGFQLSFLSTLGILGIKPLLPLQKYFLVEDIGTTLAAQLATFPVLFSIFGQYGVLSILVNACVLWTIPYLMIFGALAVVGGLVFVPLGQLFAWLSLPFLLYFEKVVSFFANLHWIWRVESLPVVFIFAYYFILVAIILTVKNLKSQKSNLKTTT
jgi:competence protein ComEC